MPGRAMGAVVVRADDMAMTSSPPRPGMTIGVGAAGAMFRMLEGMRLMWILRVSGWVVRG
jgi:hypothetical protein